MSEFGGLWKHTQKSPACTLGWVAWHCCSRLSQRKVTCIFQCQKSQTGQQSCKKLNNKQQQQKISSQSSTTIAVIIVSNSAPPPPPHLIAHTTSNPLSTRSALASILKQLTHGIQPQCWAGSDQWLQKSTETVLSHQIQLDSKAKSTCIIRIWVKHAVQLIIFCSIDSQYLALWKWWTLSSGQMSHFYQPFFADAVAHPSLVSRCAL